MTQWLTSVYTAPTLSNGVAVTKAQIEPAMRVLEKHDSGVPFKVYRVGLATDQATTTTSTVLAGLSIDIATRGNNSFAYVMGTVDVAGSIGGGGAFYSRTQFYYNLVQQSGEGLFYVSKTDRQSIVRTWKLALTKGFHFFELNVSRDGISGASSTAKATGTSLTVIHVDIP